MYAESPFIVDTNQAALASIKGLLGSAWPTICQLSSYLQFLASPIKENVRAEDLSQQSFKDHIIIQHEKVILPTPTLSQPKTRCRSEMTASCRYVDCVLSLESDNIASELTARGGLRPDLADS